MADGRDADRKYEFDGFVVDAVRRTVARGARPATLTSKAFDTLLFLIENRGTTVTKREIMDAVWHDAAVEENNLTQQISALRKAFGEHPGDHRFIVTVPGKGYSFIAAVKAIRTGARVQSGYSLLTQIAFACAVLVLSLTIGLLTIAASRGATKPTIAVLAFHATDGSDDSLGAGMRYTLTAKLGSLRDVVDIRPAGRLPDTDAITAGRELAVDAVLDGTIQHVGDQVRVTVQMVDVRGGRVLWGKSIDASATQTLEAQDAVANEVLAGLTQVYARG